MLYANNTQINAPKDRVELPKNTQVLPTTQFRYMVAAPRDKRKEVTVKQFYCEGLKL